MKNVLALLRTGPKDVELYEKMNRPVSRDEFLNRCWGMDYFSDAHFLDQEIHMLRKKIGGETSVIETVRSMGYRFRSCESQQRGHSDWDDGAMSDLF